MNVKIVQKRVNPVSILYNLLFYFRINEKRCMFRLSFLKILFK